MWAARPAIPTRTLEFAMIRTTKRKLAAALAGVMPAIALTVVLQPPPAQAYNVCSDDEACVHEKMSALALGLLDPGSEAAVYAQDIWNGAGHEDGVGSPENVDDHIYGYPMLPVLNEAVITMPHFWDADAGDAAPSTYGEFNPPVPVSIVADMLDQLDLLDLFDPDVLSFSLITTENALQKSNHLWTLALGAYTAGDKHKAYEYLGHIVHLMGDQTVPTHAHNDAHVKPVFDGDPYENWMSDLVEGDTGHMNLEPGEQEILQAAENSTVDNPMMGHLDENVPAGVDPLYYLLYTTNQLADFFASRDVDGDAGGNHNWIQGELTRMEADPALASPRVQEDLDDNDNDGPLEDINNDDGDLDRIRDVTYRYGIRAIAALYRHFERTVRTPTLAVAIDYVKDDDDDVDLLDDADMYAKVSVNGKTGQNRGEEAVDQESVTDPGWAYGASVPLSGTVPVHVEIWDEDGQSPLVPSFNGNDDLMDISPDDDEAIRGLNLNVDMAKCIRKEPGAITGDITSTCGQTIDVTGDNDPFNPLEAADRARVKFRLIVSNLPPVADAGPDRTTPEGADITLDGSGSFDPEGGALTYSWDLDGDGACDDSSGDPTPEFTSVGNDRATTVKVCVTDPAGLSSEDTATVTVTNVAPSIEVDDPAAVAENTPTTVAGTVRDPGWEDSLSATVDWGDGSAVETLTGDLENERPDATFTFSTSHTYGDNGTFPVKVCAADDDTTPCTTIDATVTNVSPTAVVDTSGENTVSVNGVPTLIAHAGASADFGARITDPGSDDLTTTWDWGDGTPVDTTVSLVNPPVPDPPSSPSIQPRDIAAASNHAFAKACVYTSGLAVTDDDGGTATGSLNVVVVGNNHPNRPHGYWKQQHRRHAFGTGPASDFDEETLGCYLDIAAYMSRVFDEETAAATFEQAYDVLDTRSTSSMDELFDQQLLAAWLNFANGAVEWNQLVDTDGDRAADTPFLSAIVAAEGLRTDPSATRPQLDAMKRIVEGWTNLP
jgi:hypothetical protein